MTRTVLDLFCGLGGFSAAFADSDNWEIVSVDIEERFGPDIQADVMDLRPKDLPDADIVLASPPCTEFSLAASSLGRFIDGDPHTRNARESVALVYHTIGLTKALTPDFWFLENPQGYLRQVIGDPDGRVTLCQYGMGYMKPTDLWGEHPAGFSYLSCSYGDECHEHNTDRANGGLGNMTGVASYPTDPAERAKIPYELSESIRKAIENAYANPPPEQTTLTAIEGVVGR